jgi:hypothetical protein
MDTKDTEKNNTPKKRMSLGDSKAVRACLCKLARQYHNGEIPDTKIRNLTYLLNSILQADKFIVVENELTSKFEQLEKLVNNSGTGTVIDPKELESPYAADLKRQLGSEQQINTELNNQLLELKRQLAGQRAEPNPTAGTGQI